MKSKSVVSQNRSLLALDVPFYIIKFDWIHEEKNECS